MIPLGELKERHTRHGMPRDAGLSGVFRSREEPGRKLVQPRPEEKAPPRPCENREAVGEEHPEACPVQVCAYGTALQACRGDEGRSQFKAILT